MQRPTAVRSAVVSLNLEKQLFPSPPLHLHNYFLNPPLAKDKQLAFGDLQPIHLDCEVRRGAHSSWRHLSRNSPWVTEVFRKEQSPDSHICSPRLKKRLWQDCKDCLRSSPGQVVFRVPLGGSFSSSPPSDCHCLGRLSPPGFPSTENAIGH